MSKPTSLLFQGTLIPLGIVLIIFGSGCQGGEPEFNCSSKGKYNSNRSSNIVNDFVNDTVSYGELDVNPQNFNEVLVGKGTWDEATGTTPVDRGAVMIDLATGEETWIWQWDNLEWYDIRWGEAGWIVAWNLRGNQLYIIRPNGDSLQLFTNPSLGEYYNPSWIADGKEILSLGVDNEGKSVLRIIRLDGSIKREFHLSDGNLPNTKYHQSADWRSDSLIVSAEHVDVQALTILSYPELELVKEIQVIESESNSTILKQQWLPGTDKIIWQKGNGVIYTTDYLTEQTEIVWQNCDLGIGDFSVMPDGKHLFCLVVDGEETEAENTIKRIYHLYLLELETGNMELIK